MGEDLFVCECGEATSDYRGGQCGRCDDMHCWDCHESFLRRFGKYEGRLAKCSRCEDDESEAPELVTEESESDEEVSSKPPHEILNDFRNTLKPLVEMPKRIWKVIIGKGNRYFADKQDAKEFLMDQFKVFLDDENNYDEENDLNNNWSVGLMNYPLS